MKNLILIILLTLINLVNIVAQGLGMTMNEVHDNRQGDIYKKGILQNGYPYDMYGCGDDKLCKSTIYIYDDNYKVIMVCETFDINDIDIVTVYLNCNFTKVKDKQWIDFKQRNQIDMKVDKLYNQFTVSYVWL